MEDNNLESLLKLKALKQAMERVNGKFSTKESVKELSEKVDEIVADGGEPNKIDEIKVNGETQEISKDGTKSVNIKVPTNVSDLDDYENYATVEFVNSKISSVYKPAGSVEFNSLPTASETNSGYVYNITDEFTTDDKFVEDEQGNTYPAGTNVVVVNIGDDTPDYKYDVLAGFIDLSDYAKSDEIVEYEDATTEKSGLMSKEDKKRFDKMVIAEDTEVDEMLDEIFGIEE